MKRFAALTLPLLLACAGAIPDHVELAPEGEQVEFAYEPPAESGFKEVGKVTAIAEGQDLEAATREAKNDLRNKAAALGAAVVTIDKNEGVAVPLTTKTRVKLVGRAYKPID